jgi:hypothetical protein
MTNTTGDGGPTEDPYRAPYAEGDRPGTWDPTQPQYAQPQHPAARPAPPWYAAGPGRGFAPDHPQASTVLVLGILGLVTCTAISPFAWWMGRRTVAEIDASHGRLGGRGPAQAGYIMGLIGTVLLGIVVAILVLVLVAWIVLVALAARHGT